MDPSRWTTASGKRRDLLQFWVGYALILAVIWSPRPYQRPLYISAVLFIAGSMWVSYEGRDAMGLRRANLLRSLWVPALAASLAAGAIFVAMREHTLHPIGGMSLYVRTFWGYTIWSFAQQLLLQSFFLARLLRLMANPRAAAFAAAGIFALAHLPNPILTAMTLVWGTAACFLFLHYRNLYPLALAHAIFGICVAITLPGPLIRNMRVGLGYLTYPRYHPMAPAAATDPRPYPRRQVPQYVRRADHMSNIATRLNQRQGRGLLRGPCVGCGWFNAPRS